MHLSNSLLFVSALIAVPAIAVSTSSTVICMTSTGTKSVKAVKTTTIVSRGATTVTITHTTNPTKTITRPAATITVTDTATTEVTTSLSTQTDTVYTTEIDTTTTTVQASPVTTTSTETDTATTTSTIGPFFTGVQDTLPLADPFGSSQVNRKRDAAPPALDNKLSPARRNILLARASPSTFPQSVTCSKIISVTQTAQKTVKGTTVTSTTTLPESTSSSTTTVTMTSTVVPADASTTSTITSTITNTETDTATSTASTTTTTTNTVTVQASPTVACDSSNYAESVQGEPIVNGTPETNAEDFYLVSAGSIDACCSSCAANPSCGAFYFTSNGQCANAQPSSSGTCSVNGDPFQALLGDGQRTNPIIVGNGLCGQWSAELDQ